MKTRDLDRERSEKVRSLTDFVERYNENLPAAFPRASTTILGEFRRAYPALFKKDNGAWSLDIHRKKVMDWLPQYLKSLSKPL